MGYFEPYFLMSESPCQERLFTSKVWPERIEKEKKEKKGVQAGSSSFSFLFFVCRTFAMKTWTE